MAHGVAEWSRPSVGGSGRLPLCRKDVGIGCTTKHKGVLPTQTPASRTSIPIKRRSLALGSSTATVNLTSVRDISRSFFNRLSTSTMSWQNCAAVCKVVSEMGAS